MRRQHQREQLGAVADLGGGDDDERDKEGFHRRLRAERRLKGCVGPLGSLGLEALVSPFPLDPSSGAIIPLRDGHEGGRACRRSGRAQPRHRRQQDFSAEAAGDGGGRESLEKNLSALCASPR